MAAYKATINYKTIFGTESFAAEGENPYDIIWEIFGNQAVRAGLPEKSRVTIVHVESGATIRPTVDWYGIDEDDFSMPKVENEANLDDFVALHTPKTTGISPP
jgi:hypothetical protein